MIELSLALVLCWGTWRTLQGGFVGPGRGLQVVGIESQGLAMGALAVLAAGYFYGIQFGAALILMVVIHEFGHVAAFRVCGHSDARFRLIPLFGGVAISDRMPASHEADFFITLMGPAICLAPMALAFSVSLLVGGYSLALGNFLYILGLVLAAVNFFNLLPVYPLDGGKLVQLLAVSFAPKRLRQANLALTVFAVGLALLTRSYFLLFFVMMGWQGLRQSETLLRRQRPMSPRRAFLCLGAYLATALAFALGGWAMIQRFA